MMRILARHALPLLAIPGLLIAVVPPLSMLILSFCENRFPALPWPGWSLRWYGELRLDGELHLSLMRSAAVGIASASLAMVIGFPAGYWLARLPTRKAMSILLIWTAPVFMPFLLFGLSFFQLGRMLGISRTLIGVAIGHAALFSPILVALVFHRCRQLDQRVEGAARELGASGVRVLYDIVGRQTWRTVAAGSVLVFVLSWDEYIVSWFLSGFAKTYPVQVRNMLESTLSPEIHAAGAVVALASVVLVFGSWGLLLRRERS